MGIVLFDHLGSGLLDAVVGFVRLPPDHYVALGSDRPCGVVLLRSVDQILSDRVGDGHFSPFLSRRSFSLGRSLLWPPEVPVQ